MSTKYLDLLNDEYVNEPNAVIIGGDPTSGAIAFAEWLDDREPDKSPLACYAKDMPIELEEKLAGMLFAWQVNASPEKEIALIKLLDAWSMTTDKIQVVKNEYFEAQYDRNMRNTLDPSEDEEEYVWEMFEIIFGWIADILENILRAVADAVKAVLGIESVSEAFFEGVEEGREEWLKRSVTANSSIENDAVSKLRHAGISVEEATKNATKMMNILSRTLHRNELMEDVMSEEDEEDAPSVFITQHPLIESKPLTFYEREEILETEDENDPSS